MASQHRQAIRVRVKDSRGVDLEPCTVSKARELVDKGKAAPVYDDTGEFYIQLTYSLEPSQTPWWQPRKRRRRRQSSSIRLAHTSRSSRWSGQAEWQQLMLDAMLMDSRAGRGAGRFDHMIVIDVESTCWENEPPKGEEHEIIEIGVCVLDVRSGDRLARDSILVQPERSRVSSFCTALTTLTPEQVAGGVSFAEACQMLRERFATCGRVWASYGDYDRRQFEIQCSQRAVDYPFGPTHINIKNLLATMCGLPWEVSMRQAMDRLALPVEGTQHRGVDDAWNTGLLLSTLIKQRRARLLA